jgi:hypothetical protein
LGQGNDESIRTHSTKAFLGEGRKFGGETANQKCLLFLEGQQQISPAPSPTNA